METYAKIHMNGSQQMKLEVFTGFIGLHGTSENGNEASASTKG
jgi:hypothetical protein